MSSTPNDTNDLLLVIYQYTIRQASYYARRACAVKGPPIEYDEILSAFHVTLSKCLEKYDPQRNISIKTYVSSAFRNTYLNILRAKNEEEKKLRDAFGMCVPSEDEKNQSEQLLDKKGAASRVMTLEEERATFRPLTRQVIRVPGGRNRPAEDEGMSGLLTNKHKNMDHPANEYLEDEKGLYLCAVNSLCGGFLTFCPERAA